MTKSAAFFFDPRSRQLSRALRDCASCFGLSSTSGHVGRDRNLLGDLPQEASLRFLDIVDRYHATADALDNCSRLTSNLRIERYWGDYGL